MSKARLNSVNMQLGQQLGGYRGRQGADDTRGPAESDHVLVGPALILLPSPPHGPAVLSACALTCHSHAQDHGAPPEVDRDHEAVESAGKAASALANNAGDEYGDDEGASYSPAGARASPEQWCKHTQRGAQAARDGVLGYCSVLTVRFCTSLFTAPDVRLASISLRHA